MAKVVNGAETFTKIGNAPLVKLNSIFSDKSSHYAKLESYNPFGSVKDADHLPKAVYL